MQHDSFHTAVGGAAAAAYRWGKNDVANGNRGTTGSGLARENVNSAFFGPGGEEAIVGTWRVRFRDRLSRKYSVRSRWNATSGRVSPADAAPRRPEVAVHLLVLVVTNEMCVRLNRSG